MQRQQRTQQELSISRMETFMRRAALLRMQIAEEEATSEPRQGHLISARGHRHQRRILESFPDVKWAKLKSRCDDELLSDEAMDALALQYFDQKGLVNCMKALILDLEEEKRIKMPKVRKLAERAARRKNAVKDINYDAIVSGKLWKLEHDLQHVKGAEYLLGEVRCQALGHLIAKGGNDLDFAMFTTQHVVPHLFSLGDINQLRDYEQLVARSISSSNNGDPTGCRTFSRAQSCTGAGGTAAVARANHCVVPDVLARLVYAVETGSHQQTMIQSSALEQALLWNAYEEKVLQLSFVAPLLGIV